MVSAFFVELRLYGRLILMQIRTQMQYKFDMVLDILTFFFLTALEFGVLLIYFVPFPSLLGWHIGEVALLSSVVSTGFGLAELFGGGIDNFDTVIRQGDFDRVLLRPVTALIQVSTTQFRLRRLGRITQGLGAFVFSLYLLRTSHLIWTPLKVIALLLGIVSSSLIFIAALLLGATVCFWTVETTELTNILTYGGREMLSYPLSIYHQLAQRIFVFIVPLAFGTYIPVCYVLSRPLPFGLPDALTFISPLVALLFALAALAFWRFGVHHYQSTGS
ncbi:MAG TPA: ABC-2 family transporter protein [Ktedonobacteraceae bacterium]|nr:ABC-2 family transporter protein [Ktedonobacteraceae bacterium]